MQIIRMMFVHSKAQILNKSFGFIFDLNFLGIDGKFVIQLRYGLLSIMIDSMIMNCKKFIKLNQRNEAIKTSK